MDKAQLKKPTFLQYGSTREPLTSEMIMGLKRLSRGPNVNRDICVENSGGNHFDMILMVANRAREIADKEIRNGVNNHGHVVTALLELQQGEYNSEYLIPKPTTNKRR